MCGFQLHRCFWIGPSTWRYERALLLSPISLSVKNHCGYPINTLQNETVQSVGMAMRATRRILIEMFNDWSNVYHSVKLPRGWESGNWHWNHWNFTSYCSILNPFQFHKFMAIMLAFACDKFPRDLFLCVCFLLSKTGNFPLAKNGLFPR